MAYPNVRFACTNDGNETFRTNGNGKLQETILSIMGHDVAAKMLPVLLDADDVKVSGYVGNTDLHRSNRNDISVTVNGRWVQDSNLAYAIEHGYGNSLPMGRRPIAVLHLTVPTEGDRIIPSPDHISIHPEVTHPLTGEDSFPCL